MSGFTEQQKAEIAQIVARELAAAALDLAHACEDPSKMDPLTLAVEMFKSLDQRAKYWGRNVRSAFEVPQSPLPYRTSMSSDIAAKIGE